MRSLTGFNVEASSTHVRISWVNQISKIKIKITWFFFALTQTSLYKINIKCWLQGPSVLKDIKNITQEELLANTVYYFNYYRTLKENKNVKICWFFDLITGINESDYRNIHITNQIKP